MNTIIQIVWSGLVLMALAFGQSIAFSLVSRARNRSSTSYHAISSIFSNGIWFLTFHHLVLANMSFYLFVPYTIATVAGSVYGAKISMWIERRLGATSDSHIKIVDKRSDIADWLATPEGERTIVEIIRKRRTSGEKDSAGT